jgi:RHS repeat-associated protein
VTSGTTVNYTYDANGNLTNDGVHSYTYDSENRLVSVDTGATASYAYDHQNRRYKKTIGSSVTHYVWEGGHVLGEYNGSNGAMQVQYGYAGSRMIAKSASGTTQCLLSDRLSVRLALSDVGVVAGRQATLPFGEDFAESGTQEKHHFTSYERDAEIVSDHALNRQYLQSLGRFNVVDPIAGTGPQRLNRYAYSKSDPINLRDPKGQNLELVDCYGGYHFDDDAEEFVFDGTDVCEYQDIGSTTPSDEGTGKGVVPCKNVGGFLHPVGIYTPGELDDAATTVFGEMSSHFNDNSRAEAEAVASIIFNRSDRIRSGTAPGGWGKNASLTAVVSAAGQFDGFSAGQALRDSGVDLNEGERNCSRLQTAGSAIAWLATSPAARGSYLYMCSEGHVTSPHAADAHINHNVFSTEPLGCR